MERIFDNVKTIGLRLEFEGQGIVNADSGDQKQIIRAMGIDTNAKNNNNQFAKKTFYRDENAEPYFRYKVSSECIRHEIFKETMPYFNPLIASIPQALYPALAMPDYIIRGTTLTRNGDNSIKKKSQLTVTDAEEISTIEHRVIPMEIHTRTGYKKCGTDAEDGEIEDKAKDTTLYNIETVGKTTYGATGFINLSELQFIPDDPMFDRMSLSIEDGSVEEKIYFDALRKNMVNFTPAFGYFSKKGCYGQNEIAERGILLNQESVDMMVKRVLKHILDINILRRNAYLRTTKLYITVNSTDGTSEEIEITKDNFNDFTFNYSQEYFEANEEQIRANIETMKQYEKDEDKARKGGKKSKADKK